MRHGPPGLKDETWEPARFSRPSGTNHGCDLLPGLPSWATFRVLLSPDFLWNLVALADFTRLSLLKGTLADSSSVV
jgi:hypothetical protein